MNVKHAQESKFRHTKEMRTSRICIPAKEPRMLLFTYSTVTHVTRAQLYNLYNSNGQMCPLELIF